MTTPGVPIQMGTCTLYPADTKFKGFQERHGFHYGDTKCKHGAEIPKCSKKGKKAKVMFSFFFFLIFAFLNNRDHQLEK